MTPGHLVADRQLALHRDEDLHHLDDARAKLVALTQLRDLLFVDVRKDLDLPLGAIFVGFYFRRRIDARTRNFRFAQELWLETLQHFARNRDAFRNNGFAICR